MNQINLENIPHIAELGSISGAFQEGCKAMQKDPRNLKERQLQHNKVVKSLEEAIRLTGLKDGMTISFTIIFAMGTMS